MTFPSYNLFFVLGIHFIRMALAHPRTCLYTSVQILLDTLYTCGTFHDKQAARWKVK